MSRSLDVFLTRTSLWNGCGLGAGRLQFSLTITLEAGGALTPRSSSWRLHWRAGFTIICARYMVFSVPFFLTIFLPLVLVGCWLVGWWEQRWHERRGLPFTWIGVNRLLLLASLLFYFWGEGFGLGWLVASVLFNALCAELLVHRESEFWRKGWVAACIASNLLFLGWFKYAGFTVTSLNLLPGLELPIPEVALPLGISFYTFQAMSYVIDVYRREVRPARSVTDFACYVTMFPQLVAGPIVRYADIAALLERRSIRMEQVASGFKRFLGGLAKKMLLANTVAKMADAVWGVVEQGHGVPIGMAWVGLLCYALQIYFDFSGYSDMAIGMGRMLGFEFKENFLHPYSAVNIRDFWRKWHISLSTWFRDYLYIPLGGNRHGRVRTGLNCLIVFGLCGLWHGASVIFLLWGLWHGLFIMAERLLAPARRASSAPARPAELTFLGLGVSHVYTLLVVLAGWVLFRSADLDDALRMFQSLFGQGNVTREARVLWLDFSPKVVAAMLIGGLIAYPVVPWARRHLHACCARCAWLPDLAEWLLLTLFGLASMVMMAGGAYNPFIYFRF
jgi:alginate O-acetyltransferase complex protein AlgI